MFLHDTLDVLTPNANNSLMVLVRDMEGYGCRHLLLYQGHSLFHRVIRWCNNINVKVVFPEAVEDNLNIAWDMLAKTY